MVKTATNPRKVADRVCRHIAQYQSAAVISFEAHRARIQVITLILVEGRPDSIEVGYDRYIDNAKMLRKVRKVLRESTGRSIVWAEARKQVLDLPGQAGAFARQHLGQLHQIAGANHVGTQVWNLHNFLEDLQELFTTPTNAAPAADEDEFLTDDEEAPELDDEWRFLEKCLEPNPNLSGDARRIAVDIESMADQLFTVCGYTPEMKHAIRRLTEVKDISIRSLLFLGRQ